MSNNKYTFEQDIKPLFNKNGTSCMKEKSITNDEGSYSIALDNYDFVVKFKERLLEVLKGHRPETSHAHPMPPNGPLSDDDIQMFEDWIAQGCPKDEAGSGNDIIS